MIKYCIKCVSSNTRPHLEFDAHGVCSACRSAEQKKKEIDWTLREKQLNELLDQHRKKIPGVYDCIVPVSGGKDSTYQVHLIKNIYHLNPLCITFRTLARTETGNKNLQALRNIGVNHIDFSPNPVGVNKLTKRAFEELGDCSLVDHLAIYSIIPNFAVKLNVPLVIWGENPLMEYGGSEEESNISQLNREFFKKHDILKGKGVEEWVTDELPLDELQSMIYPGEEELDTLGYTPIFLGYYLPWDARKNAEIAEKYGFTVREKGPIMGLYDYADLDCMNIVIHHYFKWLKFGFNRVTDHASNEIRKGRLTREDAIKLVRERDGHKPPEEYIRAFCKQIDITELRFWEIAEKFRNLNVWKKDEKGEWYIEGWIGGDKIPDRFPYTEL